VGESRPELRQTRVYLVGTEGEPRDRRNDEDGHDHGG